MILALGIVAAVVLGALNGILIAEAMYGRWPHAVIEDSLEGMARWLRTRTAAGKQREREAAFYRRSAGL